MAKNREIWRNSAVPSEMRVQFFQILTQWLSCNRLIARQETQVLKNDFVSSIAFKRMLTAPMKPKQHAMKRDNLILKGFNGEEKKKISELKSWWM